MNAPRNAIICVVIADGYFFGDRSATNPDIGRNSISRHRTIVEYHISSQLKAVQICVFGAIDIHPHAELIEDNVVFKSQYAISVLGNDAVAMAVVGTLPAIVVDQATVDL